ncbi:MAG: tetratricopeptide repeat protein [Proteobacteria bacterium]|nr:tetratricopeptide repeat protein [Pseudomonadota bacterium]
MEVTPQISQLLTGALEYQRRGDLAGAEAACRAILKKDPGQPDALQLLGLIAETRGDLEEAETLMRESLAANPAQPHVLNNLGNLLNKKGEGANALKTLKKATQMHPEYGDAWYNMGKVLFDLEDFDAAITSLEKAKTTWPHREPKPQTLLGNIAKHKKDYEKARKHFEEALKANPNYFNALHNYGLTLKLLQKPAEALKIYHKAEQLKPGVPELYYNMANACYEMEDMKAAFSHYRTALKIKPDYLEAHNSLNELLWREGKEDEYLQSYREAIPKKPDFIDLRLQFFESLIGAGQTAEAKAVITEIFKIFVPNARAYRAQAVIEAQEGKLDEALRDLEKSTQLEPEVFEFRKDIAKFQIRIGRYQDASAHLKKAREVVPFNQEIIAYQALCWRLLGDDREKVLMDYENFIKPYVIEVPEGYESLEEFNLALNKALDQFHHFAHEPSDQTVTGGGGTQSLAAILDRNVKEIQELKKSLQKAARLYISELPEDPNHPLLCRKSDKYKFSGSFSIRLRDQGWHFNHTHPDGWISGCYYVSLPDVVKDGKTQQGWIKFGESPINLGEREVIGRIIQPQEGIVAFFPSYMFHGTVPFTSSQRRTTLPMDIIPCSE